MPQVVARQTFSGTFPAADVQQVCIWVSDPTSCHFGQLLGYCRFFLHVIVILLAFDARACLQQIRHNLKLSSHVLLGFHSVNYQI